MSYSVTYPPTLIIEKKRKEKEIEKEINIDLAIVASQWFKVANYNNSDLECAAWAAQLESYYT